MVCLDDLGGVAASCPPRDLCRTLQEYSNRRMEMNLSFPSDSATDLTESPMHKKLGFFGMLMAATLEPVRRGDDSLSEADNRLKADLIESRTSECSDGGRDEGRDEAGTSREPPSPLDLLVQKEEKATGSVGFSVYWFYLKAGGGILSVASILVTNALVPLTLFIQNYNLSSWMGAMETGGTMQIISRTLYSYLVSAAFVLIAMVLKNVCEVKTRIAAASNLHSELLTSMLTATIPWHDSQPSGRKMNRFSQDISTIDSTVMTSLQDFLDRFMGTVQVVFVILALVPALIPIMVVVLVCAYLVTSRYLNASREVRRLESVNKSPVFILFSETLAGMSTVRAFRHQERFFDTCCRHIDIMNRYS